MNNKKTTTKCHSIRRLLESHPNVTWLAFLRESTRVDWGKLGDVIRQLDSTKVSTRAVLIKAREGYDPRDPVTSFLYLSLSTPSDPSGFLFLASFQEWFIGHELYDKEPTIVHHFAFHHDPSAFKYPAIEAGVLLSQPVLKR